MIVFVVLVVLSGRHQLGQLGVGIQFRGSSDLHGDVWEIFEAVCHVNVYNVIPQKRQPHDWACQFLHYDRVFNKRVIPNVESKCDCC